MSFRVQQDSNSRWAAYLWALIAMIGCLANPGLVWADGKASYRLVTGDVLQVSHPASDTMSMQTVDLDGNIRLVGLRPLAVTGRTLAETTASIQTEIANMGIYLDPKVTVSVASYAPLVVAGDVAQPGQVAFIPGLTVAGALALAGGRNSVQASNLDLRRIYWNVSGQLKMIEFELAVDRQRLRALHAVLKDDFLNENEMTKSHLSDRATGLFTLENRDWLANEFATLRAARKAFQDEMKAVEVQVSLLEQRLVVERGKADVALNELQDAEALQAKGLQTSTQMAAYQRRVADATSDVLELENAMARSSIALIQIRARKDQFLAQRREGLLAELRTLNRNIRTAEMRQESLQDQLRDVTSSMGTSNILVRDQVGFKITSPRGDRMGQKSVGLNNVLLPGDTLTVYSVTERAAHDG